MLLAKDFRDCQATCPGDLAENLGGVRAVDDGAEGHEKLALGDIGGNAADSSLADFLCFLQQ